MKLADATIGVIGGGVVGRATARVFLEHVRKVHVYDQIPERRTSPLFETINSDIVFLCLPTPGDDDGKLNTSSLDHILSVISRDSRFANTHVVIKSTVPIGYTRKSAEHYGLWNLTHSPEFLTARCAQTDAMLPAQQIIGLTGNGFNAPLLREIYGQRFPDVPIRVMSSNESEATKLFLNSFFAVKVAYFNEIHHLSSKLGLDWDSILQGMLGDGRIAPYHCNVPGPDGKYGFGGSCLPKDIDQLIWHFHENGMGRYVTTSAKERNRIIDRNKEV